VGYKIEQSSITPEDFHALMDGLTIDLTAEKNVAVAVSGGGDSLALTFLLFDWCVKNGKKLHALTINHGLRAEATDEAQWVSQLLKSHGIKHKTLNWDGEKPTSRIQETAREIRYKLLSDYCHAQKIRCLFLAHHGQDQIETILFRLCKGTGLDGLAGMSEVTSTDGIFLIRPLLSCSHSQLLATMQKRNIDWIEDPSNSNNKYARVRIRNILDVLEKEGLNANRIGNFSRRMKQYGDALEYVIENEYKNIELFKDTKRIEINYNLFSPLPHAIKAGLIGRFIDHFWPNKKYAARLEDIEKLSHRMTENFKGATLGSCLFKKKKGNLIITREDF
jgi:tRNA(Ile)-lysidine synthase